MNQKYNTIKADGCLVIKNFLSENQVKSYRDILDNFFKTNSFYRESEDSKIIPGFANVTPELKELNILHKDNKILGILKEIFNNQKFIFADHSDLHQNKITGWHRDTMDYLAPDRGAGSEIDLWSEDCFIVKVCFLLQNHIDNDYGLWFKPKTHLSNIDGKSLVTKTNARDMIVFDQRILHAGQTNKPRYHEKYNLNRYLITYGYGLDNKHTRIHSKGATIRQNNQRKLFNDKNP